MKVIFSIEDRGWNQDSKQSFTVDLTLDAALYWEVKQKVDDLANELVALNANHLIKYSQWKEKIEAEKSK